MESLEPDAIAQGLLEAAEVCNQQQAALRMRLIQGARMILQLKKERDEARLPAADESIPMFLRRQAT